MSIKEIQNSGLVQFITEKKNNEELLKMASKYGTPYPDSNGYLIQKLESKSKDKSLKKSLSFNFGLGKFPYHTDTAFTDLPARYLLLTSVLNSKTPTNILDFYKIINNLSQTEIKIIENSIFALKTPQESRFVKMIFKFKGTLGVRFDPNIMTPYNKNAKNAIEIIENHISKLKPYEIDWTNNNVIIIDNWRCLHSRSKVIDDKRILKRIYIK